ncbi:uncharacterized protein METZ01_LOCUS203745 [marine metagenome]|uniref:Uncharacterized protein n=1 Tax=marine metagenome TaxID=408172 RepID=A0A382ELQ1_9ZZZZ
MADGARVLALAGLAGSVIVGVTAAAGVGAVFGLNPVSGVALISTVTIAALTTVVVAGPTSRVVRWAVTGGLPVDIDLTEGTSTERTSGR